MNYFKEFEAIASKLNELLAENMLTYKFSTAAFPITLTITPDASMDAQMTMYEQSDDGMSSSDAKLVYSFKVNEIAVRVYGRLIITEALMNKIKGLAKKMHYVWLQCYFADSISTDKPQVSSQDEADEDTEPDFGEFYDDEFEDTDEEDLGAGDEDEADEFFDPADFDEDEE